METNLSALADQIAPLSAAFLGDALWESKVRQTLLQSAPFAKVQSLHKQTVDFVCARGQAQAMRALLEQELSEQEIGWFKRGRNQHSSVPKNADVTEYRLATGFEYLLGYLSLKGQQERVEELMERSIEYLQTYFQTPKKERLL